MYAADNTNLASATIESLDEQNIVFVAGNNRFHVLNHYQNVWNDYDIFDLIGKNPNAKGMPSPPPNGGGTPLAGYSYVAQDGTGDGVVAYIDENGDIEVLVLSTAVWNYANLTTATKAPQPDPNTGLAGYAWQGNPSQHVIYVSNAKSGDDVIELYASLKSGGWEMNNLTQRTGAPKPRQGSPLAGYAFESQGTEHVIYIDSNNDIRELYYNGAWRTNNLSRATNAPKPAATSPLAAYVTPYDSNQHVFYIAENGDVQELYWAGGSWTAGQPDLTQSTSAPQAASGGSFSGWSCQYEQTEHVAYQGLDGYLYELYHADGQGWGVTYLIESAGSGATQPKPQSPLIGYAVNAEQTDHVIYVDNNAKVHELYRSGQSWNSGEVS
jgi:hypothetical protein